MQTFALANYKSIVVTPVSSKGAQLPRQEDNSYQPVMDALAYVTATFAEGVSAEAPRDLNVSQGSAAGAGALLIRARVTAVHPGSEAARHFGGIAGLAGGAASVAIAGEVVDGKTRKSSSLSSRSAGAARTVAASSASARKVTTILTPASSTAAPSKSAMTLPAR